jgi:hypothetical protein
MLEREFEYYKAHQKELTEKHSGKFIVIVGEAVIGVYDSEIDAFEESQKTHEVGTFLIQRCLPIDNLTQTFHSRVVFPSRKTA